MAKRAVSNRPHWARHEKARPKHGLTQPILCPCQPGTATVSCMGRNTGPQCRHGHDTANRPARAWHGLGLLTAHPKELAYISRARRRPLPNPNSNPLLYPAWPPLASCPLALSAPDTSARRLPAFRLYRLRSLDLRRQPPMVIILCSTLALAPLLLDSPYLL
jgi:hypothetical protein